MIKTTNQFVSISPRKILRGFTLVEVLIAALLFIIVVSSLMVVTVFVSRSFKAVTNYDDLDRESRYALDLMNRDIRNAAGLSMSVYLTNNITLTNSDGSAFSYQWSPYDSTFKRFYTNAAGQVTVTTLLTNCDTLSFYLYTRYPTNNLQFNSATNVSDINETKLINVDWRCSRNIMGTKYNTESIQTAQITIRN
jgi:Tfp pilus assembly protein PilW